MADVDERGMDGIDLYADVDDFAPEGDPIEADLYDDVISSSRAAVEGRVSGIGGSVGASSGIQSQADSSLDIDTKVVGGDSFKGQPKSVGFSKRHAIIIANLTWWTTDRDITDAVANCGVADLKDIKFYENRVNGQSKGFATVILESEQSCRLVIDKLPSRELHGQTPIVTAFSRAAIERFDTNPSAPTGTPSSASKQSNSASKDSEMNSFHNGHHQQQHIVNPLSAPVHMLPPPSTAGPPPQLPPGLQLHMPGTHQQPTAQNIAAAAAAAVAAVARSMQPGGLGLPPRPGGPGVFVSGAPPGFTGMLPPLASPASRGPSVPPPMFVPPPSSSGPGAAQLMQPPPRLPPPHPGALPPNHVLGMPPPVATSMGQPPPGMTSVAPPSRMQTLPPPGMLPVGSQQQTGGMMLRGPGGLTQMIDHRTAPPPTGGARLDFLHLRPPPGPDPFQPGGVASSPAAVAAVAAALHQQRTQTPAVSIAGLPPGHQLQQLGIPGMPGGGMSVPPPHMLLPGLAAGTAVSAAAAISSHQTLATQHVNQTFYQPTAVSVASMHLPVGSMVQLDPYGRPMSVPAPAGVPAPSNVVAAAPVAAGHVPAAAASDPYQQLRSAGTSSHHQSSSSTARESPVDRRGTPGYSSEHRYRHHRSRSPAPRERERDRDRERERERERERDSSVDSYHRGGSPRSQSRTRHDSLAAGGSGSHHHMSSAEFEEILQRNKTVSSSAISRAVQDASAGEFVSAIETLVTAIALIKQSRISHDDRCRILISSLQDTLHGIESKSYTSGSAGGVGSGSGGGSAYKTSSSSGGGGGSSREQHRQRSPPSRSSRDHNTTSGGQVVEKSRSGGGDYHRSRSREERGRGEYSSRSSGMERERSQRDIERERSSRDMESSRHYESSSADRREREAYRERGMDRDREREREREREYASRSSRH